MIELLLLVVCVSVYDVGALWLNAGMDFVGFCVRVVTEE